MLKIPEKLQRQLDSALEYYEINQRVSPLYIKEGMNKAPNFWFYFNDFIKKNPIKFQNKEEERALAKLFKKYWNNTPREYLFGFSEKIKNQFESLMREFLYSRKDHFGLRWGGLAQPVFNQLKAHLIKLSLENLALFSHHHNFLKFKADFQQRLNKFFSAWLYEKQEEFFNLSPLDYFFLENEVKKRALPLDLINWQAGEVNILMELEGKEILRQRKIMKRMQGRMQYFLNDNSGERIENFSLDSLGRKFELNQPDGKVKIYEVALKEKFTIVSLAEDYGNQALKIANPFFAEQMVDRDIARFSQSAFVPAVKISVSLSLLLAEKKMGRSDNIARKIALDNLNLALDYLDVSLTALEGINKKFLFIPQANKKLILLAQKINPELRKTINNLRREYISRQ